MEKQSAEERAYGQIIRLILSGQYKPGDFLLEVELAPRLGMSRTPVSRALGRLVVRACRPVAVEEGHVLVVDDARVLLGA